jgi:UDP-glucuronate 4-epimerase
MNVLVTGIASFIGNAVAIALSQRGDIMRFIAILKNELGKTAIKEFLPMQAGNVPITWADTAALEKATSYCSKTSLEESIKYFAQWHLKH